jgi:hypothetical protein
MVYHLGMFATWLREKMSIEEGDIEILSDRAAIPKDRKRRPTTRWDHLVKQQSFSMPKVPTRRRLGETIEEDAESTPSPLPRLTMSKQASFTISRGKGTSGSRLGGYEGDGGTGLAARPRMVKQASLRRFSLAEVAEVECMKMPRLAQLRSSPSKKKRALRGIVCGDNDDDQSTSTSTSSDNYSINNWPCVDMNMQNSSSLPKRPSRPSRQFLRDSGDERSSSSNARPHLAKQNSFTMPSRGRVDSCSEDETGEKADTLSSMPRCLLKQTSFTIPRLSSRGALMGDDKTGGNGATRRRFAKQSSFTMPKRPTRTVDSCSEDESDETADTVSSMPRLMKQLSFTVSKSSSRGPLMGDDDGTGSPHKAKQNSFAMPRRPTRTLDSDDETGEKTATDGAFQTNTKSTSELSAGIVDVDMGTSLRLGPIGISCRQLRRSATSPIG